MYYADTYNKQNDFIEDNYNELITLERYRTEGIDG